MADEELVSLDGVVGSALSEAQVRGIIAQIDLDIMNLLRDGKLAAMKYDVGGDGPSGDRGSNLKSLIEARWHYEKLLEGWSIWMVTSSHEA